MKPTITWLLSRSGLLLTLLSAFIFDRLFFRMAPGLNAMLFNFIIVALLVHRVGWSALSRPARWAMIATAVAATMVVVHHSVVSVVATVISTMLFAALALEPRFRSLPFAMVQAIGNYLALPAALVNEAGEVVPERSAARTGWRWLRISLLPLFVLMVFFQLYRIGNPRFDHLTAGLLDGLWEALSRMMDLFFTAHTLFFLFALVLCAGLLHRFVPAVLLDWEQACSDAMLRVRRKRPHWLAPLSMNALDQERRRGIMLLILVNVLLVIVNTIDINWVWFGFVVPEGFSLKQFVHEGTWVLIFSILLSIVVVLYLFRGNLNFHPRGTWLKRLALLWVVQNFILGISVFLRNWHYISFHGLAYRRIGVIVFLALVLVGLVALLLKVRQRRSLYFLLRVNAWAAFTVMIALTLVDWDSLIVRFNLKHPNQGEIDIDNYLAMSDKVLPLLYANLDLVQQQMMHHRQNRVRWVESLDPIAFRDALDSKRDAFIARRRNQHWQEWNWADQRTFAALEAENPS